MDQAPTQPNPVTFAITLVVKPDHVAEFEALLMPVLDRMRHEATFLNAILHRDPQNEARFMLYETWADLDDVANVQMHRDYRAEYWARLPDILAEPRQIETWHPVRCDMTSFARS